MTLILIELQKWKRSKIVGGIIFLTLLLGIYTIDRACSISRSSPMMDSFGDLYTLAFKNLTSLYLPIVLGMFSTTLFFDELKSDTLKSLLIIPISKSQLFFTKLVVVILISLSMCVFMFSTCALGGFIAGDFPDMNVKTLLEAALLHLTGGILLPIAMLPIIFLASLSKGYLLPITATLLYLVPVVIAPSYLMGIHPLASVMGIYSHISSAATEMVVSWIGGSLITIRPIVCIYSLLLISTVFTILSIIVLKKQNY